MAALGAPVVVKHDGLAAGKGVIVPADADETTEAHPHAARRRGRSCSRNASPARSAA